MKGTIMLKEKHRKIESARNGDEAAMALLMEEAWPVVFRHLSTLGAPESDISDLVQEALIRGMTKLDTYHPEKADLHTWLCAIARNLFLDQLKKRRRESSLEEVPECGLPVSSLSGRATGIPARESTGSEDMAVGESLDLKEQLALLPQDVRFAVMMRYVHGCTNKMVARMLGIPEGTVKSKIHYGLGKLRKGLMQHA